MRFFRFLFHTKAGRQFVGKLKIESKLNHVAMRDDKRPLLRDAVVIGKKKKSNECSLRFT